MADETTAELVLSIRRKIIITAVALIALAWITT